MNEPGPARPKGVLLPLLLWSFALVTVAGAWNSAARGHGESAVTGPGEFPKTADAGTQRESPRPVFSRPEERGENFAPQSTDDLLQRLEHPADAVERLKAAKELGDRAVKGGPALTDAQQLRVTRLVDGFLVTADDADVDRRSEGRVLVQYLWTLAVPALMSAVEKGGPKVLDTAAKSLVLMRDEAIVNAVAGRARVAVIPESRERWAYVLSQMNDVRKPVVDGRPVMSEAASAKVFNDVAVPVLDEIARRGADEGKPR